jgi:hypothetical protein
MTLNDAHKWTDENGNVLILRGVGDSRKSYNGFPWPAVGEILTAPDWDDSPKCGGGLHGWPWGFGVGEGKNLHEITLWQVCSAKPENIVGNIESGCKCKFRTGTLLFEGEMAKAFALVASGFSAFVIACAASGDGSTLAASGDGSTLAASGDGSTLAASGYGSTLAASGYGSTLAASGDHSKLAASGDHSKLAASGYDSTLAASGYGSTLAASGYGSTLAASGDDSVVVAASNNCIATVGAYGVFALRWTDADGHPRITTGRVGVRGIKAGFSYRVNDHGKIVKA